MVDRDKSQWWARRHQLLRPGLWVRRPVCRRRLYLLQRVYVAHRGCSIRHVFLGVGRDPLKRIHMRRLFLLLLLISVLATAGVTCKHSDGTGAVAFSVDATGRGT